MRIALAIALATLGCSDSKKSPSPTSEPPPALETPAPQSSAGADRFGPKLAPKPQWTTCASADDCTKVYSGCGMHSLVVNATSVPEVKQAWLAACGNRPMIGVVPAPGSFQCVEGQCKRSTDAPKPAAPAAPAVAPAVAPAAPSSSTNR